MKIQYVDKQGVETILKLLKNKISSIVDAVVFRGTVASVADLPSLSDPDIKPGNMYTVLTESQTTADFVEGAGETIDPYTEVVVVNQGTVLNPEYKWYVLGNVFTTKDKISYGQSLPNMPYDGMLFFYMGPDVTTAGNELYSNSFYSYNESENTWDYLWTLDDKIWRGTQAEWDALSAAEKDKYEQAEIIGLDNNGVIYVADKVELNNFNPVTSDAVARYTSRAIYSASIPTTTTFPARPAGTQPQTIASLTVPKGTYIISVVGRIGDTPAPNVNSYWPVLDGVQYMGGTMFGWREDYVNQKNMRYFNPCMTTIARYAEEHTIEFKEYFEGDAPEHYYNAAVIAVKIGD